MVFFENNVLRPYSRINHFNESVDEILESQEYIDMTFKLTFENEQRIRKMFNLLSRQFNEFLATQNKRMSFWPFCYVFYKLCQLLKLDHLDDIKCLYPQIKRKYARNGVEEKWKSFCIYAGWKFIPTNSVGDSISDGVSTSISGSISDSVSTSISGSISVSISSGVSSGVSI